MVNEEETQECVEEVSQMHEEDVYPTDPAEDEEEYTNELNRLRDLALATMRGEFGLGQDRKDALGEDYEEVIKIAKDLRLQNGTKEQ